ncbi:MAG: hypothetical protein JST93_20220 [Acidobacteria bacterium]|nr:hypothetical protein [Acidobacteriota bacterium]
MKTALLLLLLMADNAALQYWAAFGQMQDGMWGEDQDQQVGAALEDKAAYSPERFRGFVDRNRNSLETMHRGTALGVCDWGLDYGAGASIPVDYLRKAATLGNLNVLLALEQIAAGDDAGAVRTVRAGLRFSSDVAAGGPLLAALQAKKLLMRHLAVVPRLKGRNELLGVLEKIGDGVDWKAAMDREAELAKKRSAGLPNPARVAQEQRALSERMREVRALLSR